MIGLNVDIDKLSNDDAVVVETANRIIEYLLLKMYIADKQEKAILRKKLNTLKNGDTPK